MRKQGGIIIIMILAFVSAGFFYAPKALASQNILISEVQITGGSGKTGNDFIEIYNPNNFTVNLKGYRLVKRTKTGTTDTSIKSWTADAFIPANGHYLWANSGYTDMAVMADATTTATIADDNGIAIRFGAADSGAIIDSLAWGKAQNAFIEGAVFPDNPGAKQSLERKSNLDTNDNSADFFIQENPNPQNSSMSVSEPPPEPPATAPEPVPTDNTASSTTPLNPPLSGGKKINFGDVVINEFLSDPGDNEVEWVELYNRSGKEIDLSGWWLEDGSKAKTNLSGSLNKYTVIEKPNGNLNNDGDLIVLFDGSGKIIDQVAYGNWPDGNPDDNAPAASDPGSTARKFDGYNTYDNFNDFVLTIKPTKGSANIIAAEDEVSLEAKAKFDFSGDIFITEILPNPAGDDAKNEFIEIYNAGQRIVDLTDWSISNEDGKKKNLENLATSTKIQAHGYLTLYRPKTKIVLHNDQGEVRLYQPLAERAAQIVKYKNVKESWSYDITPLTPLLKGGEWVWSETVTPGKANLIKAVNQAPEVEFSFKSPALVNAPVVFDSSDTADADGDELKYNWDFGDGMKNSLANPEHVYLKIGIYKVKLAVSDGKEIGKKEKSVQVVGSLDQTINVLDSRLRGNDKIEGGGGSLIINEIFPNPKGADTGQEWVELKNQSAEPVDLLNWRVENSNGKYKFDQAQPIGAGAFYVLDNLKSKLAFKNSADVINLYNDLNELADQVEYAGAVQGEVYARGANGNWFWTTMATPGAENVIKVANSQSGIMNNELGIMGNAAGYIETTLEKVRELELGSLVKVKGTVAAPPGILGAQIFYIVGSPGMQIYNYKKDFPALRIGDYVEVAGELTQAQGELRIKTKDKSDININEHKPAPVALAMSADAVSEENLGQLIAISGEITDKKSNTLYLDDGNGEILAYIKQNTGITTKNLAVGQNAVVSGILSKTTSGLRLLPRYQSDIAVAETAGALEPQVLGEVAVNQEWEVAARDKKMELFKYLLIIAGGVIIISAGLFIKIKRKV